MFYRSFKAVLANTTETKYALKENLLKIVMTLVFVQNKKKNWTIFLHLLKMHFLQKVHLRGRIEELWNVPQRGLKKGIFVKT